MELSSMTSPAFGALLAGDAPVVALLPVGSVEPHGPHLPLGTDTTISWAACRQAVGLLRARGVAPVIAPAVPFGVTECAAAFPGALSVSAEALGAYLRAVVDALLRAGAARVCLVNNHLEPAHDAAVREAVRGEPRAVVACPLERRFARTLTPEFKRGECHAGRYETSIVLAAAPELVDEPTRAALPEVPISLSEQLGRGITDFREMGLARAYAGAPALASSAEGEAILAALAEMITAVVCESLDAPDAAPPDPAPPATADIHDE